MKYLDCIVIKDYKIFGGKHMITLSHDEEQPITLVETERGSGKTTLQEAIFWCLFGETIYKDFRALLLNHEAAFKMKSFEFDTVEVELLFHTETKMHSFKRVQTYTKKPELVATDLLLYIDGAPCDKKSFSAAVNKLTFNGLGKLLFISNAINDKSYSKRLMRDIFSSAVIRENNWDLFLNSVESEMNDIVDLLRKGNKSFIVKFGDDFLLKTYGVLGEPIDLAYGTLSIMNLSLTLACIKLFEEQLIGLPVVIDEILPCMHIDDEVVIKVLDEVFPRQTLILLHNTTASKLCAAEDMISKRYFIYPNRDYTSIEING